MIQAIVRPTSCLVLLGSALLLVGCADSSEKNNAELAKSRDAQSQAMGAAPKGDVKAQYDAAKAANGQKAP